MSNLYVETAEAAVPTPPLDGDLRCDVAVVGAGITGLSAALHLAEQGTHVVVLDAAEPGWGASGRNGGQVNPGLKHDPDVVERDFGPELGARMNALAGAAPRFVFDLIERCGIACEARRNGTLRVAVHPHQTAKLRASGDELLRRGAPVELLEAAAVERATGTNRYVAALFDRRGGDLNPLSYARGLARSALRAGAAVHGGTRALGVGRVGSGWRVETPRGGVLCEHLILATNGYTDDLWPGLRRTIVPLFGAIAASAVLPPPLANAIMPGRAVLYETGAVTVYYRIDAAHRLVIGGRGPLREIASPREIPHLLRYARRLWPALEGIPWTHAWGGRLAMTRDQYPHVHEPFPGVLVCLGYNGRGVAMSSVMGALLAQRLLHPADDFDMPISAARPIALHALWPLGVRAAILRGRLLDRLGV
jgi:glycine/D-amino acid oxidase-like deaminating enzyme